MIKNNQLFKEENTLEIRNLSVEYRTHHWTAKAVNDLSLSIKKSKTLGLVGETGAGKTTIGLAVLGLVPHPPGVITNGSIMLNSEELLTMSEKKMERIRGREVSMIFQDPMSALNPVLTIEDQISEVIRSHNKISKDKANQKAREALELVGIPGNRIKEYPHQFSGGMKQRVVIAIALACNPALLIADEPTTALDVTIQAQVLDLMRNLRKEFNMSMLMITHDLGIIAEICDDVSVIYAGHIIEHGSLEDVFDHPMHPYTIGLFNSLPKMNDRKAKLEPIRGLMPDPGNLPKGCTFSPRCKFASNICFEQFPEKSFIRGEHFVTCHLFENQTSNVMVNRS